MLKICGITYTFTSNYGSCLQSYALQTAVEQMSNRLGKDNQIQYMLIPISKSPGYPKGYGNDIKNLIKRAISSITRQQFLKFEKDYIKYAPVYPLSEFKKYNDLADAFVCGSDVIWNPKYNHRLNEYYLDFANKYAFSYSASFGQSSLSEKDLEWIGPLISKLDSISVREQKSAEIARQCTDKEAVVTVDPVLLLDRNHWEKIAEKTRLDERYIFIYSVNTTPLFNNFVRKLSAQTGLKVINSPGNAGAALKQGKLRVQTPQEWLGLIRNAEYVVTDSFHGTAFSTLFHKTFYTIVNGDPNDGFNMRMSDYLKRIDLENRLFSSVPDSVDVSPVIYEKADVLLENMITHSKMFLENNLRTAYEQSLASKAKESI